MLKRLKSQKGFTLIELLIVIVIIGILAGIVIGLTGASARRKANDATKKADMHELQNAVEQYFVDNNVYPASANWQQTLVTASLLQAVKVAPGGAGDYTYAVGNPATTYTMSVNLENTTDTGPNVINGVYTLTQKQ